MGTLGLITITILALVVLAQLWRVLGTYDPSQSPKPAPKNVTPMPFVPSSNSSNVLTDGEKESFLQGARQAHTALIEALFAGDLTPCQSWLDPQVRLQFTKQLADQRAAGYAMTLQENVILDMILLSHSVENGLQEASVQYNTRMVYSTDQSITPIRQTVIYTWTFTKLSHAASNTWRLSAAQADAKDIVALPAT